MQCYKATLLQKGQLTRGLSIVRVSHNFPFNVSLRQAHNCCCIRDHSQEIFAWENSQLCNVITYFHIYSIDYSLRKSVQRVQTLNNFQSQIMLHQNVLLFWSTVLAVSTKIRTSRSKFRFGHDSNLTYCCCLFGLPSPVNTMPCQ